MIKSAARQNVVTDLFAIAMPISEKFHLLYWATLKNTQIMPPLNNDKFNATRLKGKNGIFLKSKQIPVKKSKIIVTISIKNLPGPFSESIP